MGKFMGKLLVWVVALFVVAGVSASHAENKGTQAEAKALVAKAADFLKQNGKEKAMAEFNNPKGQFTDKDLHISAFTAKGVRLAQPGKPQMLGRSVTFSKDMDGKAYGQEMVDLAAKTGEGFVDYKFPDPSSNKAMAKSSYVLKVDDVVLTCGFYKP